MTNPHAVQYQRVIGGKTFNNSVEFTLLPNRVVRETLFSNGVGAHTIQYPFDSQEADERLASFGVPRDVLEDHLRMGDLA